MLTESAAALSRDILVPRVIVPLTAGPHTYRVEVSDDEDGYTWYIDGTVVDSGVPDWPYPDPNAFVIWGPRANYLEGVYEDGGQAAFDYVRFGTIPLDGSGDYDASVDGVTDFGPSLFDYYFLHDCLTKNGPVGIFAGPGEDAGPGCRAFDFFDGDGGAPDGDVDLRDFAAFQNLFFEWECWCCDPFCDEVCCP